MQRDECIGLMCAGADYSMEAQNDRIRVCICFDACAPGRLDSYWRILDATKSMHVFVVVNCYRIGAALASEFLLHCLVTPLLPLFIFRQSRQCTRKTLCIQLDLL